MPETPQQPATPEPRPSADADASDVELARFLAAQDARDVAAAAWFVRRQDGLSAGEESEFQRWLRADPAHAGAMDRFGDVWRRTSPAPSVATSVATSAASLTRRAWMTRAGQFVPQAAVAGMALAVVGGGWWAWRHVPSDALYTRTLATPRGQQARLDLPDGSTLTLDAASRAQIVFYRDRREVHLSSGQALFSVQTDAARPFHVLAGALRITVVGTRFAVRHLQGDAGVLTSVQHGRVRLAPAHPNDAVAGAVDLSAGQAVAADPQGRLGDIVTQAPERFATWSEGRIVFDNTPLADAIAEFERYGDTGLVVSDPDVAAMRVSGSFELRQSASFMRALPQVLPVKLRRRDDGRSEVIRTR